MFFIHHAIHILRTFQSLPPVLEMPATFNLELTPGEHVAPLLTLAYGDMETVGMVRIYSSYIAYIPLKTLENSSLILMECVWRLLLTCL